MRDTKKLRKIAAFLAALALSIPSIPFAVSGTDAAEETAYVSDGDLSDNGTADVDCFGAVPTAAQYDYQKQELAAFLHFGMNTFTGSEWGDGLETPDRFTLSEKIDADHYVRLLQEAGFQSLMVVAKHHDGFCMWDSAWTEHDTASTNYPGGDVLADISAACTKYNMKMGLYLSPWDENSVYYGYYDENGEPTTADKDVLDYNDYYAGQLAEILGNDKYGNNGEFFEIWMDGAKGTGADAQEYDMDRYISVIRSYEGEDTLFFGAGKYSSVHWIGNEAGIANEETWSKGNASGGWIDVMPHTTYKGSEVYVGRKNGNVWSVPEVDARITSGWFWGVNKRTPKTTLELRDMYMDSVGHNSVLLLNVPLNDQGKLDAAIEARVADWGNNLQASFHGQNLAAGEGVTVLADSVHGNDIRFKPSNAVDGNDSTYWTAEQGKQVSSLVVDFGTSVAFDAVTIEEEILHGQRVESFTVWYQSMTGEWYEFGRGTTIGSKRVLLGKPVRGTRVKIEFVGCTDNGAVATPLISHVGVYKTTPAFELGSATPDGITEIVSTAPNFDTTGWQLVEDPTCPTGSYHRGRKGDVLTATFTGSKVWVRGLPVKAKASVSVDGGAATVVELSENVFYESEDLPYGEHTVTIEVTFGAAQIDGILVLDNGGKGLLEFEQEAYFVNEDTWLDVKVVRKGGSAGRISAILQDNPGSAVQSSYVPTEGIPLVFEEGEIEKTVRIRTKRYAEKTGSLSFTLDLVAGENETELAKGFRSPVRVEIFDAEQFSWGYMRGIEITELPDRTEYELGESFDPSGLVVTGVFNSADRDWNELAAEKKLGEEKTIRLETPVTAVNLRLVLESVIYGQTEIPCIGEIEVYHGSDGVNLALNARASAVSEYEGMPAAQVNDGDPAKYWIGENPLAESLPVWIQLEWQEAVTFDTIVIREWADTDGYRADEWRLEAADTAVFTRELEADEYEIAPVNDTAAEGQQTYVVTARENSEATAEFSVTFSKATQKETESYVDSETVTDTADDGARSGGTAVIAVVCVCVAVAAAATVIVVQTVQKKKK